MVSSFITCCMGLGMSVVCKYVSKCIDEIEGSRYKEVSLTHYEDNSNQHITRKKKQKKKTKRKAINY